MWGVLEAGPAGFSELVPEPRLLPPGHLRSGLACCHTVALLRGQLLGDPLELKMVESTGWVCYRVTYFKVLELACISFKNLDFLKIIDENVCLEALSVSQSENINGNWSSFFFLILQTLQEPDGDGSVLNAEFGGHKVLAVMRPPDQQAYGAVSIPVITDTG